MEMQVRPRQRHRDQLIKKAFGRQLKKKKKKKGGKETGTSKRHTQKTHFNTKKIHRHQEQHQDAKNHHEQSKIIQEKHQNTVKTPETTMNMQAV